MSPLSCKYLLIIFFASWIFGANFVLASSDQCIQCHQEVMQRVETKTYTHKPVLQNQCELCHLPNTTEEIINDIPEPQWVIEHDEQVLMEWLVESFVENSQQHALLPLDVCDSEIIVKLWFADRNKRQDEISCPPLDDIEQSTASRQLEILQLHRQSYNDQLMPRTTLHWETTTPSRCTIRYRTNDSEYEISEDDIYTVNHTQEIKNFNAGDTSVSIHCEDHFQRHAEHSFRPLDNIELITSEPERARIQPTTTYSTQFRRIGDFIELEIRTTQLATVAIGRIEQKKQQTGETEPVQQVKPLESEAEQRHQLLSGKKQVNTTICFKCHRSTVTGASHPINVVAPPGMIIPAEYPLLSDGKLTCMTCHSRHASNNEARLLKQGKKELCTGCHTNY